MDSRTDGQMAEWFGLSMCSFKLLMGPRGFSDHEAFLVIDDELVDQVW